METINKMLAKIGSPVWKLFQTSKHHHIGGAIVILVAVVVLWVVI